VPHKAAIALVLVIAVGQFGCVTPAEVSKFCTSAIAALQPGDALFDDIKSSCVRELQTQEDFGKFSIADPSAKECDDQGKHADGLKAAAKILTGYFTALNELASFDAAKNGGDANALVGKVGADTKLSAGMQKSVGVIGGFLTRVATSGYRQAHLTKDLASVRDDVQAVMNGLGDAIGVDYLRVLGIEEQKAAERYREFGLKHPDAVLTLDARWQSERAVFDAKRKAAQCYKEALDAAAKGNGELVAHAHHLKAKDLSAALTSYSSQLDSLAPVIRKAF
jgi:hypothetical protein